MSNKQVTYPWDVWFKRAKFTLTKGKEYNCQPHSMVIQIRNVAASKGLSVSIRTKAGVITVTVKHDATN